jgi:hypothetical protein
MKIVIAGCTIRPAQLITIFMVSCLSLAAIVGGTNAAPVISPNGSLSTDSLAHYKFEETSGTRNDSIGANHLTSNNSVGYTASGKHGNAATFVRASSQSLSIADNGDLSMGDISFCISSWVNLSSIGSASQVIASKGNKGSGNQFAEYDLEITTTGYPRIIVGNGSSTYGIITSSLYQLSSNTWYFIVGCHDSTNNLLLLYVNNNAAETTSYSSGSYNSSDEFSISKYPGQTSGYVDGIIDSVTIWKNRVLSSGDITNLYASGAGCDFDFSSCEATATPTATNTPTTTLTPTTGPSPTPTNTLTPTPVGGTATFTPTPTGTPNWQTGFDLPPSNSLILEYRATVGDIAVTIVGAFLLLVLSLYAISRMFGPWAR